jgi:hypothetical protein
MITVRRADRVGGLLPFGIVTVRKTACPAVIIDLARAAQDGPACRR